ncbi:hypothetical protein HK104_000350 [Borealophlyctis nickersoniae]|nr:hypothetical protein HK104_000350 [Borealophlyctis nickersoniae]
MPSTNLERIVAWKEPSSLIVVEDSTKQASAQLLRELVAGAPKELQSLVLCCIENSPQRALRLVPPGISPVVVNVHSSVYAWDTTPEQTADRAQRAHESTVDGLADCIEEIVGAESSQKITVLLDSLNSLILGHPLSKAADLVKRLSNLSSDVVRIIVPFHGDIPSLHSAPAMTIDAILAHLCTTYINVRHSKDVARGEDFVSLDAQSPAGAVCDVIHKKKSGRVARELVYFEVSQSTGRLIFTVFDDMKGMEEGVQQLKVSTAPAKDPTANLSFNLRLTEEQKSARSEVVLPYMKAQEVTSEPTIYYEPDDDDYDEEDPDDDLDI